MVQCKVSFSQVVYEGTGMDKTVCRRRYTALQNGCGPYESKKYIFIEII